MQFNNKTHQDEEETQLSKRAQRELPEGGCSREREGRGFGREGRASQRPGDRPSVAPVPAQWPVRAQGAWVCFTSKLRPADVHARHLATHATETSPSPDGGHPWRPALKNVRGAWGRPRTASPVCPGTSLIGPGGPSRVLCNCSGENAGSHAG